MQVGAPQKIGFNAKYKMKIRGRRSRKRVMKRFVEHCQPFYSRLLVVIHLFGEMFVNRNGWKVGEHPEPSSANSARAAFVDCMLEIL